MYELRTIGSPQAVQCETDHPQENTIARLILSIRPEIASHFAPGRRTLSAGDRVTVLAPTGTDRCGESCHRQRADHAEGGIDHNVLPLNHEVREAGNVHKKDEHQKEDAGRSKTEPSGTTHDGRVLSAIDAIYLRIALRRTREVREKRELDGFALAQHKSR